MYVELLVGVAFNTSVPVTEELKAPIRENKRENDEFSNLPRDGKANYGSPSCLYCPTAQFSAEVSKRELEGTVVLETTIRYRRAPARYQGQGWSAFWHEAAGG
jgi:hypothetical protein